MTEEEPESLYAYFQSGQKGGCQEDAGPRPVLGCDMVPLSHFTLSFQAPLCPSMPSLQT